jgi:transketolase
MKKTFEKRIFSLMKENEKIVLITADNFFVDYNAFLRAYPDRCYDFGIAECNAVGSAAGFAKEGFIPVVYAMGAFLAYRAYEFIRDNICIQKLNVKFVGMGAGVKINTFGATHHATEDIAVLRVLPNLTLLSPASPKEVSPILEKSLEYNGAAYIRLGKGYESEIYENDPCFEIGKSMLIRSGNDITIISTGSIISNVIEAVDRLRVEGITADIINMVSLKPVDEEAIIRSAKKTGCIVTVEEHQIIGGLGSAVSEVLCSNGVSAIFERMGFKDTFCLEYGWHRDLLEFYGLSSGDVFNVCKQLISRKKGD